MKNKHRHILFVCTEDWFFRSHFLPLNDAALSMESCKTTVLCNSGAAREDLEKQGLRVLQVDFARSSIRVLLMIKILWQLCVVFCREKPDLIHFISLKPMFLGGLASLFVPRAACVYHLTGMGYLVVSGEKKYQNIKKIVLRLITWLLKRRKSWLILENPTDCEILQQYGFVPPSRITILGGSGVSPDVFTQIPAPKNKVPIAAFVGRIVWSKGLDVLIEAMGKLAESNTKVELHIYGAIDNDNPRAISNSTLEKWNLRDNVSWKGHITDVREVWKLADFIVVPSRGGEGLPRSLLEAAACGRPLIVTDVPGCRDFVRENVEGYIVPPEDSQAIANAMMKLTNNLKLRQKMGKAARRRLLEGYTETHVRLKIANLYEALMKT